MIISTKVPLLIFCVLNIISANLKDVGAKNIPENLDKNVKVKQNGSDESSEKISGNSLHKILIKFPIKLLPVICFVFFFHS